MKIGAQIIETLRTHRRVSANEASQRMLAALAEVGIEDPTRVAGLYPHEVSGGMGQRVMIAMMTIAEPELLIADEPTSALDVTVQLQVLAVLDKLVRARGMGLIFISHDLRLVSTFCDRILIMYAGRVVETLASGRLNGGAASVHQGLAQLSARLMNHAIRLPTLQREESWK